MGPRFGRDLSDVRIHTDSLAAESAREVNALAYTVGRQIVFARNQYSPHGEPGRRLLAHELTHVLQQSGSAFHLQRACGPKDIATEVGDRGKCTDHFDNTFLSGLPLFKFDIDCDTFAAGEDARLTTFVAGLPATTTLEIHGFASTDGPKDFNQNLGCARASAAQSLITTASPPTFSGISSSRITAVVNHGPVRSGTEPLANLRSVVIRSTGAGPKPVPPSPPPPASLQTVTFPPHIRAASTPPAMVPDRIPPRADTPIDVTFGGSSDLSAPVALSVDGTGAGNGSATINGSPTFSFVSTGTETLKLRGVEQTDPGKAGHLKLIARQHGTLLAESAAFSVSSIPQNMSFTFNRLGIPADCTSLGLTGCKLVVVDYKWESDSTVPGDLDKADQSERVQMLIGTGIFAGAPPRTSCYLSSLSPQQDFHGSGNLVGASDSGFSIFIQDFMFRDNRTGASEIPMTHSGFQVTHLVSPKPGTGFLGMGQDFQFTVTKAAVPAAVTDPNTTCPSKTIVSAAGSGSVTKTQDL
jgi:hypothetical protein